jgi:dihydrofolate reductase
MNERKIIFAINMTIDGFADHTSVIADDELHDFFADFLNDIDVSLMGRKTYQLMESYWPDAHKDPECTESIKRFADKYNSLKKIIFSNTLKSVEWQNSVLAEKNLVSTVLELKKEEGKNISAGSIDIARQLFKNNLIDEFWFVVHPVIAGKGSRLFDEVNESKNLQLIDSKKFDSGAIAVRYINRK